MDHKNFIYVFCILSITISITVHAQQPYIRKATTLCDSTDNSTSIFGYTCNGVNRSCQSYLTFRSHPPFNTVSSISALMAADPTELSQINSVPENTTFDTDKMVLVPVQCSCSGQYYQSNTSYVTRAEDTYFVIANNTYQGLSTCQALQSQNSNRTRNIFAGTRINVPLRCSCPTKNQTDDGVKYLLSYLITWGEFVSSISSIFGVDTGKTLAANGLSDNDFNVYPFTTLLVPLENPPSSLQTSQPPPPPPPPPPPQPSPSSSNSSNKTWVYAVVAVVAVLALGLITGAIVYCFCFRKRKVKKADPTLDSGSFEAIEKPLNKGLGENSEDFLDSISSIAQSMEVYKFEELKSATENFSPSCLIKGSVYRGTINGDFAAIKRMNGDVSKEINLLNKINHFNLIRLSGVCFSDGHWYLVYEYASNGSLSDWICNNSNDQKFLNWRQRIQIALDVATGLNYLHSYTSPPHVHKDLRISNVLLDSDLRAKIANFGLARSAEVEGHFITRHIVGTKGYMAPEYLENGLVSPKLDVYAFGVLMLEMFTGKEISVLHEGVNSRLFLVLNPVLREEESKEILSNFMDLSLQGNYPAELAYLLIRMIDRCLNEDPSNRPGMGEIVQSLSSTMRTTLSWELSLGVSGFHSAR